MKEAGASKGPPPPAFFECVLAASATTLRPDKSISTWNVSRLNAIDSPSLEANSLSRLQLVRIVDRIGRPPHVSLPGIGARLAAAARLLLAAERPADLRAARADVHVRDPAVAADRRAEEFCFADVAGEDGR